MYSFDDLIEDIRSGMSREKIHKKYGGLTFYIQKTVSDFRERIVEEFTGDNHSVLAHKYNVSTKTVYEIIKKAREK